MLPWEVPAPQHPWGSGVKITAQKALQSETELLPSCLQQREDETHW